ncbi:MAG: NAD(P)-dependent oxidoreductase [Promethearchaeota archaeon]
MPEFKHINDLTDQKIVVCFTFDVSERLKNYLEKQLKNLPQVNLIFPIDVSEKSLIGIVPEADIIVGWRPSRLLLKKSSKLKLYINPGAGVSHLIQLFREINRSRKVLLVNGHGNSYFVAQHAVALLLTMMNKVLEHHLWMSSGNWRTGDKEAASMPLRYRKIGLLGYGHINQKVHRFLQGFDVEFSILRYDWAKQKNQLPTPSKKYEYSQFHDFLKEIDVLIVALPLTYLTKGMIARQELTLLGSNGLVINVSRGEIIDEESLFIALRDKIITGAAIDVWYNYHPKSDEKGKKYPFSFPFHTLDNIILSPHRGYSPFNDLMRWDEVIENITRLAKGRDDFINIVDLDNEY